MSPAVTTGRTDFLEYSLTIGVAAMGGRGFYYPVDLAFSADERIYVLGRAHDGDPRGVQVIVCDLESEFYEIFASRGDGDGQFIWPTAIAIDGEGNVYVSDEHSQRITIFDRAGGFLAKWGVAGSGPGELNGPSGLAFDGEGTLYVVDHWNNRVQRFTRDGKYLSSFGEEGAGDGQFRLPWGITVDGGGDLYVADWGNDRIQRFSAEGEHEGSYGTPGRGERQLHRPSSVAVDGDGHIYIANWGNERVQVLGPGGEFVTSLRGEATNSRWAQEFLDANVEEAEARARSDLGPDLAFLEGDAHEESYHTEKFFWSPVSVKLDEAGRLYVTDRNRHRVQVYERGSH